jgi:uncharacterized coiled-coil DUF342 family protein
METGNTATQFSPGPQQDVFTPATVPDFATAGIGHNQEQEMTTKVPEDEMGIRELFANVANAIVEASRLRAEVSKLAESVKALTQRLDEVSADRNKAWAEVDRLRAESESTRIRVQEEIDHKDHEIKTLREGREMDGNTITALRGEVQQLRQERDEARGQRDEAVNYGTEQEQQIKNITERRDHWRDRAQKLKEAVTVWRDSAEQLLKELTA